MLLAVDQTGDNTQDFAQITRPVPGQSGTTPICGAILMVGMIIYDAVMMKSALQPGTASLPHVSVRRTRTTVDGPRIETGATKVLTKQAMQLSLSLSRASGLGRRMCFEALPSGSITCKIRGNLPYRFCHIKHQYYQYVSQMLPLSQKDMHLELGVSLALPALLRSILCPHQSPWHVGRNHCSMPALPISSSTTEASSCPPS